MKLKGYLPLKAVLEDLGVSRWTLWRAAASNIPDFPAPLRVGRQLFWKKSEMDALEAALIQFRGRCVFDRERQYAKKLKTISRAKRAKPPRRRKAKPSEGDLFSS